MCIAHSKENLTMRLFDVDRFAHVVLQILRCICVSLFASHVTSFVILKVLMPDTHQHVLDAYAAHILGSGICTIFVYRVSLLKGSDHGKV